VSDPFATAQELGQFIGLTPPADLSRMQAFLEAASAEIRGHLGQTVSQVAADVVTLGPTSKRTLYLPERPVTAITTVLVSGVAVTAYSFTEDGNIVHGLTPAAYSQESWPFGATVTYDHGYAETSDEYKRIKTVCLEVAANAYTLNSQGASEMLGGPDGANAVESAGWAPAIFLTPSQRRDLTQFDPIGVG
jgi:hypothetical protein